MRNKIITSLVIMLALFLAIGLTSLAKKGKHFHYNGINPDFTFWEVHCGQDGAAPEYGEDVVVHYESVNKWVLNRWKIGEEEWEIKQALTQNGTATIYKIGEVSSDSCNVYFKSVKPDGDLGDELDTKGFRVVENTQGLVDYEAKWYHVKDLTEIKNWNYHWRITGGVLNFFASCHGQTCHDLGDARFRSLDPK